MLKGIALLCKDYVQQRWMAIQRKAIVREAKAARGNLASRRDAIAEFKSAGPPPAPPRSKKKTREELMNWRATNATHFEITPPPQILQPKRSDWE